MANGDLKGTLIKEQPAFPGLDPASAAALNSLLNLDTGLKAEDLEQGEQLAGQAFQSIQEEISGRQPPPGVEIPESPSPLATFLSVFLANVGAQAARDPSLAQPTLQKVARIEQERKEREEFNFKTSQEFRDNLVKDRLIAVTKQTMEALDLAQEARDDKTAAAKAGQLARLNSLLRQKEERLKVPGRLALKATRPSKPEKGPKPEITEAQFNDDIKALQTESRLLQATVRPPSLLERAEPKKAVTKRKAIGRKMQELRRRKIDISLLRQPGDSPEEMAQRVMREVPELQNRPGNDPEILRIARIIQRKFPEVR